MLPPEDQIERLAFASPSTGFATGEDELLATRDGGQRWTLAAEPAPIPSVPFAGKVGLAVACGGEGAELLASTDLGRGWRRLALASGVKCPYLVSASGWEGESVLHLCRRRLGACPGAWNSATSVVFRTRETRSWPSRRACPLVWATR
jgi:hypothetical protein